MQFEWDEDKNRENQRKHGIAFEEAALIFSGVVLTRFDDREYYGEIREVSTGMIGGRVTVVVAHTDREGVIRLISARLANKRERKAYDEHYQKIVG